MGTCTAWREKMGHWMGHWAENRTSYRKSIHSRKLPAQKASNGMKQVQFYNNLPPADLRKRVDLFEI